MSKGTLRQQVLWIVRDRGPITASAVCSILREERSISLTSVQTVLSRLVAQDILIRTGSRRHYVYEAQPSEATVRERAARAAIDLLSQSGELGFAHFLDTIDQIRPEAVQRLERLLSERREKSSPQ